MYERLGEAVLKTGERMEIGVVTAPDPEWRDRIVPYYSHKGESYHTHIRRAHEGPLDELETRFYLGHLDGRIITQVMIVGARGAGILGHVFTVPEERRKGAYQALMGAQVADMPRHGFRVLTLGTGFDSPPYWIYHSYGFRSLAPGMGQMKWCASESAEAELFRPGHSTVREARWDDWGCFGLLSSQAVGAGEELPRSRVMGLRGQGSVEGTFVRLMLTREKQPEMLVRALQSEHGATVGWAILSPSPQWLEDAWVVDLHTHPNFTGALPDLLAGLPWPDAPVAAPLTEPSGPKAAALEAAGFSRAVRLPVWFRAPDGTRRDVTLWTRG
jgi:hypothetical protein